MTTPISQHDSRSLLPAPDTRDASPLKQQVPPAPRPRNQEANTSHPLDARPAYGMPAVNGGVSRRALVPGQPGNMLDASQSHRPAPPALPLPERAEP
ncbi:hypothetical protein ACLESO_31640, partial [Pyxidicoccus sp. 3LG]